MWVATRLQVWGKEGFDAHGPAWGEVRGPEGSPGFLVVFDTPEDAYKAYGSDVVLWEIRFSKEQSHDRD